MSVLVTGSVAVDHIMVFEDHFKNHFVADKLDKLNVAFHVPSMAKKYGGTARISRTTSADLASTRSCSQQSAPTSVSMRTGWTRVAFGATTCA